MIVTTTEGCSSDNAGVTLLNLLERLGRLPAEVWRIPPGTVRFGEAFDVLGAGR